MRLQFNKWEKNQFQGREKNNQGCDNLTTEELLIEKVVKTLKRQL